MPADRFATDPLARAVRLALTADLLKPAYAGAVRPYAGHCYVASEAYFHLAGGAAAGLRALTVRHENSSHWWLLDPRGQVVDLTAEQFHTPVPYVAGRGIGFLTREPSKRAQIVIDRVCRAHPELVRAVA